MVNTIQPGLNAIKEIGLGRPHYPPAPRYTVRSPALPTYI